MWMDGWKTVTTGAVPGFAHGSVVLLLASASNWFRGLDPARTRERCSGLSGCRSFLALALPACGSRTQIHTHTQRNVLLVPFLTVTAPKQQVTQPRRAGPSRTVFQCKVSRFRRQDMIFHRLSNKWPQAWSSKAERSRRDGEASVDHFSKFRGSSLLRQRITVAPEPRACGLRNEAIRDWLRARKKPDGQAGRHVPKWTGNVAFRLCVS